MFLLTNKLNLQDIFPTKVSIWKSRCHNPMRKSSNINNIKVKEFDALILITSEMSKLLYPYVRAIVSSFDNRSKDPQLLIDFEIRFIELIQERYNMESIKVRNLIDINKSENIYKNLLVNLALSISEEGEKRLKETLLNL